MGNPYGLFTEAHLMLAFNEKPTLAALENVLGNTEHAKRIHEDGECFDAARNLMMLRKIELHDKHGSPIIETKQLQDRQ